MAANLGNTKNLDDQLLPGLGNKGISKSFKNSIYSFNYNDINSLEKIFKKQESDWYRNNGANAIYKTKNNFLKM